MSSWGGNIPWSPPPPPDKNLMGYWELRILMTVPCVLGDGIEAWGIEALLLTFILLRRTAIDLCYIK